MELSSSPDQVTETTPPSNQATKGLFLRRIFALIIDGIILGIIGSFLGIFLFDTFVQMGGWGRLVGFSISLAYFGILNSSMRKGQTVGKLLMKIQVVDGRGSNISLGRSCLRSTIILAPFCLNNILLSPSIALSPIGWIIGFIDIAFGGSIIYLFLFNRHTRQSLHDLLTKTFVIKIYPEGEIPPTPIWKPHLVIVGIGVAAYIALSVTGAMLANNDFYSNIADVQNSMQATGKIHSSSLMVNKHIRMRNGNKHVINFISSNAFWKTQPDDFEAAIKEIASIIISEYPDVMNTDMLVVTVTYGYDIGISSGWKRLTLQDTPQNWRDYFQKQNTID